MDFAPQPGLRSPQAAVSPSAPGAAPKKTKKLPRGSMGMAYNEYANGVAGQSPVDAKATAAQQQILKQLLGISRTGYDATDKARMAQIQQQGDQQAAANRAIALEQAQRRGVSPASGFSFASMLQGNQAGVNNANRAALEQAIAGGQRRMQALGAADQAAGGLNRNAEAITRFNEQVASQKAGYYANQPAAKKKWWQKVLGPAATLAGGAAGAYFGGPQGAAMGSKMGQDFSQPWTEQDQGY